jgi:NADPH:quinone reductase-like Zn-dependent oxidoreductase
MKAVVLHEYGGPEKLKLEDWDDPVAGEGEVLVRTAATSVNPVDYKMRSGAAKDRFPVEFPGIIGRDLSGVIRAVGDKVEGFLPGDEVMTFADHTYAELVVVKATDLARVPQGLDIIKAAALPLVTLTGSQLITEGVKVQSGKTILVTGAIGGVGRTAIYVAKQAGATVIAGVRKSQLKEAESLGADKILALDDHEAIGELGFIDAVADTVGGKTAELLIAKVKQGGVYASVVGPPANARMHPTITLALVKAHPDAATLEKLAEAVRDGNLTIPIDRMVALEDAGKAQADAEKGGIGKILLLA